MRKAVPLALLLLLLALLAAGTASRAVDTVRADRLDIPELQGAPASFRDTVLHGRRFLAAARFPKAWGGPVAASDGETVTVVVSDAYAVDPAIPQSAADFLTQLYHGDELSTLTLYLAPLDEVQSICGPAAAGCYGSSAGRSTIISPGTDLPDRTSVETILAHEYGHHVAQSRDNAPWRAVDWGTKRWASYANVCARQVEGTAFPGDEGENYYLNPGEAFAESYRLLNFQRGGWESWIPSAWNSDGSFYPGATALDLARQDVLEPWTGPQSTTWAGRFVPPKVKVKIKKKAKRVRLAPLKRTIATPLDGVVTVTLDRAPAGTTVTLSDESGAILIAPPNGSTYTVCGQRSLLLTVRATKPGAFSATIATP